MNSARRIVFMDHNRLVHPPTMLEVLSALAARHRDDGSVVAWLGTVPRRNLGRGDLVLDLAGPPRQGYDTAEPSASAKTLAVVETIARFCLPATVCVAYGDLCTEPSALPLVGTPRVVACCPDQAQLARARGLPVVAELST